MSYNTQNSYVFKQTLQIAESRTSTFYFKQGAESGDF